MRYLLTALALLIWTGTARGQVDDLFEDISFPGGVKFFRSAKVDFLRIKSSVTPGTETAIVMFKPSRPSPILLLSHGWHQSVKAPTVRSGNPYPNFLTIQVDMRGREYSTGKADCNGYELYDFYDAYLYALEHNGELVSDPRQVYYMGGSGGGGNGFGIVGKFPDLFCSALITCGMSDYAQWYAQDAQGEFRDEMDVWIGCTPGQNPEAYASRSGITTVSNLLAPLYVAHGETDVRVPVTHSREYVEKARAAGKQVTYLELPDVGTRDHWGNITPQQLQQRKELDKQALSMHSAPELPVKGELVVAGYVVTRHFSVFMDSVDSVGEVSYDLKKRKASITSGKGKIVWKK